MSEQENLKTDIASLGLRRLVIDLIEQIDGSGFENVAGYLVNNIAYINLKNSIDAVLRVGDEQSFKSGINDMVRHALDDKTRTATLKNCQSLINGKLIKFTVDLKLEQNHGR